MFGTGIDFTESRLAVILLQTVVDEQGRIIPCIAVENQQGYYKTDWRWGTDWEMARGLAREYNDKLGLTEQDVIEIQLSTMRA
jgi:hypothetical protein